MPKVLQHTPRWLNRPTPGFAFFNGGQVDSLSNGDSKTFSHGVKRTVAHRGTEVFTAIGHQVRWSDLHLLKEQAQGRGADGGFAHSTEQQVKSQAFRLLKVPVHRAIRQLSVSPSGEFLAILTSHTVHIVLLPDASFLVPDSTPLKVKSFQLGPTAHVLERAPVISALWHPLATSGCCLVTVTEDSVARLWDIDRDNRWSFDNPSISLDLRKLANGTSANEDFSPSKYGTSNGFSPDQFDMEAAASCFGGVGSADEEGWSAMTLWVAMKNGDLYALCPLLPSKWSLANQQLDELIKTIEAETLLQDNDSHTPEVVREQQAQWARDVLDQKQKLDARDTDIEGYAFEAPLDPGTIPSLQGPFEIEPSSDAIFDVTDISAIASSLDKNQREALDASDENDSFVPATLLCIATSDGRVHICCDVEGVQARWMPRVKGARAGNTPSQHRIQHLPGLVFLETIKLYETARPSWPVFSTNNMSRESLFVTHSMGVSYLDPTTSLTRLSGELEEANDRSGDSRLKMLAHNNQASIDLFLRFPEDRGSAARGPTACIHVSDEDFGDWLLTVDHAQPHAVHLDFSGLELLFEGNDYDYTVDTELKKLFPEDARESYQPPQELWAHTALPHFTDAQKSGPTRQLIEREIRLAPASVNIMMEAHRILGSESETLQNCVSSLFQRCERMQDELRAQLVRVHEISSRVDSVLEDMGDIPSDESEDASSNIPQRLEDVRERYRESQQRFEDIRAKMNQLDRRPLSDKERLWIKEVDNMDRTLKQARQDDSLPAGERLKNVLQVKDDLISRANAFENTGDTSDAETTPQKHKQGFNRIYTMLERETALVDATSEKLDRLKLMV